MRKNTINEGNVDLVVDVSFLKELICVSMG